MGHKKEPIRRKKERERERDNGNGELNEAREGLIPLTWLREKSAFEVTSKERKKREREREKERERRRHLFDVP